LRPGVYVRDCPVVQRLFPDGYAEPIPADLIDQIGAFRSLPIHDAVPAVPGGASRPF